MFNIIARIRIGIFVNSNWIFFWRRTSSRIFCFVFLFVQIYQLIFFRGRKKSASQAPNFVNIFASFSEEILSEVRLFIDKSKKLQNFFCCAKSQNVLWCKVTFSPYFAMARRPQLCGMYINHSQRKSPPIYKWFRINFQNRKKNWFCWMCQHTRGQIMPLSNAYIEQQTSQ